jgi:nucleoside-triphosphatase
MQTIFYLLTAPIHTGKSTVLQAIAAANELNCAGILVPNYNGLKVLQDADTLEVYPFEKKMQDAADDVVVGKYIFSKKAFVTAQYILAETVYLEKDIIFIDEIGKLELEGKGLEPALGKIIESLKNTEYKKVIAVVRDYLVDEVITKYNLQQALVIDIEKAKEIFVLK